MHAQEPPAALKSSWSHKFLPIADALTPIGRVIGRKAPIRVENKKNTSMPLQYLQASEKHCGLPSSVSEGFRETNPGSRCQQSLLMLDLEFSTRSGSSAQTSQTSVVISCHRVRACCLFYPCHHSFANIASLNPHHDRISNIFLLKHFL